MIVLVGVAVLVIILLVIAEVAGWVVGIAAAFKDTREGHYMEDYPRSSEPKAQELKSSGTESSGAEGFGTHHRVGAARRARRYLRRRLF